jgi:hypothetical protein
MNPCFCENCIHKPKFYRLRYNISTSEVYIDGCKSEDCRYCYPQYCRYDFFDEFKQEFEHGFELIYIPYDWWQHLTLHKSCPFYDKYLIEELN